MERTRQSAENTDQNLKSGRSKLSKGVENVAKSALGVVLPATRRAIMDPGLKGEERLRGCMGAAARDCAAISAESLAGYFGSLEGALVLHGIRVTYHSLGADAAEVLSRE